MATRRYRQVHVALGEQDWERLRRALQRHRLNVDPYHTGVTAWLRRMLARDEADARHPLEAEHYVRMVIPEAAARCGAQACQERAQTLLALARQHASDPWAARAYRKAAGPWLDAAGFFETVLTRYDQIRRAAATSGQSGPPTADAAPPAR